MPTPKFQARLDAVLALVAAGETVTTAAIAARLGLEPQTVCQLLEYALCTGAVRQNPPAERWRKGMPGIVWLPSDGRPKGAALECRAAVLAVADRHGRASRQEIRDALGDRFTLIRIDATVEALLSDGTVDAVGESMIGRPDAVDRRSPFGAVVSALRDLARPVGRAEAGRLFPDLDRAHLDAILFRAAQSGFLTKEGDLFAAPAFRKILAKLASEDVIAAFPPDRPIALSDLHKRLSGFNTRALPQTVATLVQRKALVKTGRGAYALPGTRGEAELALSRRALDVLRGSPGRDFDAAEMALALRHDSRDLQALRLVFNALLKAGDVKRTGLGRYALRSRRRTVPARAKRRRRPTIVLSAAAAATAIRKALAASGGFAPVVDLTRRTRLTPASFQAGFERLVRADAVFVVASTVVSLDPPARLDGRAAPPLLRVLGAVLTHGSFDLALEAGALGRDVTWTRLAATLVKMGLLAREGERIVPGTPRQLLHLKTLVRAAPPTMPAKPAGAAVGPDVDGTKNGRAEASVPLPVVPARPILSPLESRVVDFIRGNPGSRKAEVGRGVGVGRGAANRAVDAAVRKGALVAYGPNDEFHAAAEARTGRRGRPRKFAVLPPLRPESAGAVPLPA